MSSSNMFWFHCGRCGSLFESPAGESDNRLCSKCGFDPATGILEALPEPVPPRELQEHESESQSGHRSKRSGKKRKNSYFMVKLIGGWSVALALIILGARKMWHEEAPVERPAGITKNAPPADDSEDIALIEDNIQKCMESFSRFLVASTPEERNQFVLKPISTASRMARFYSMNPITNLDPSKIGLLDKAVLKLPSGKAIETRWKSEDGRTLEALYLEENGEWRLDWEHFARYSDYPWSLFLAGSGDPVGEFRLLARERLAEENKDAENISLVFYSPRFGQPLETGFQSPEFLVSRSKPEGKLLDAAFKLARNGKQVFDSKLPNPNPEGMIRVRLKVRRTEVDMERKFEITGVSACHWFSVDDPGVAAAEPTAVDGKPAGQ